MVNMQVALPSNEAIPSPVGQLAIQLVLDLLDTCNFAFTKRVGEKERAVRVRTVVRNVGPLARRCSSLSLARKHPMLAAKRLFRPW